MNKRKTALNALAALVITAASAGLAAAQTSGPPRTFTSAQRGHDANPCTLQQPCRSIARSLSMVAAGGEVIVLDSGGYGPITITKSVTVVVAPGTQAVVPASSSNPVAVTVSAAPTDVVVLRGLTLTGYGVGAQGIFATSAGVLHVENCTISGFVHGILHYFINSLESGKLYVKDTVARNNGYGIRISGGQGTALTRASIDHCRLENNSAVGLIAEDHTRVSVSNSIAAGNDFGFFAAG